MSKPRKTKLSQGIQHTITTSTSWAEVDDIYNSIGKSIITAVAGIELVTKKHPTVFQHVVNPDEFEILYRGFFTTMEDITTKLSKVYAETVERRNEITDPAEELMYTYDVFSVYQGLYELVCTTLFTDSLEIVTELDAAVKLMTTSGESA